MLQYGNKYTWRDRHLLEEGTCIKNNRNGAISRLTLIRIGFLRVIFSGGRGGSI